MAAKKKAAKDAAEKIPNAIKRAEALHRTHLKAEIANTKEFAALMLEKADRLAVGLHMASPDYQQKGEALDGRIERNAQDWRESVEDARAQFSDVENDAKTQSAFKDASEDGAAEAGKTHKAKKAERVKLAVDAREREREAKNWLGLKSDYERIAEELWLTVPTVKAYLKEYDDEAKKQAPHR